MMYSPILIPTLNRKEHLERCINSLALNSYAKDSELFISVDYPPSDKYITGYQEVKKYLNLKITGFKKVNIYYQEKNIGPFNNVQFLKNKVRDRYDTYIFSEDDNEFSANFLEYINKGLEIFENNKKIMAICGFRDTNWISNGNNVCLSKLFAGYGFGAWFKKEENMFEDINNTLLFKNTLNIRTIYNLFKHNKCLFNMYISNVIFSNDGLFWDENHKLVICDSIRSIYMHLCDITCIVPDVSKSRTWGNDGSGVNMPKIEGLDPQEQWRLDDKDFFEYELTQSLEYNNKNYLLGNSYLKYKGMWKSTLISLVEYVILVVCLYDIKTASRLVNRIKAVMKDG